MARPKSPHISLEGRDESLRAEIESAIRREDAKFLFTIQNELRRALRDGAIDYYTCSLFAGDLAACPAKSQPSLLFPEFMSVEGLALALRETPVDVLILPSSEYSQAILAHGLARSRGAARLLCEYAERLAKTCAPMGLLEPISRLVDRFRRLADALGRDAVAFLIQSGHLLFDSGELPRSEPLLSSIFDSVADVFQKTSINDVLWESSSFENRGDSAAALDFFRRYLVWAPGPQAQPRLHRLASILSIKLIRDWNTLIAMLHAIATFPIELEGLIHTIFVNLLFLKRDLNPILANDNSDLELTSERLHKALIGLLKAIDLNENNYLATITMIRLLPGVGNEDRIGTIRALSERFDEDRDNPMDPYRTRANSLRKMIHQKPSERNIDLVQTYLLEQAEIRAGRRTGPADADEMVETAASLLDELKKFWTVVTDDSEIARQFAELRGGFPELIGDELELQMRHCLEAVKAHQLLKANRYLTDVRKELKNLALKNSDGAFRYGVMAFEVVSERMSFAYQSQLCNEVYKTYVLSDLDKHIELLCQIIKSVRAFGGADKQLGRTGMLLEAENQEHESEVDSIRQLIKDILNLTKQQTDIMKNRYRDLIPALLREMKPGLGLLDSDRYEIGIYNYFFRSTSFLHLGEYAAFLSAALLPYVDTHMSALVEQAERKDFWRFYGSENSELPSRGTLRYLVGGKAASLLQMHRLGMPVPAGFSIASHMGSDAYQDWTLKDEFRSALYVELSSLEKASGLVLGNVEIPLLISVRSGAPISMPGMMDTILNIGLNDDIVFRHKDDGDFQFWCDCYIRLINMFAKSTHSELDMPKMDTFMRAYYHHKEQVDQAEYYENLLHRMKLLYRQYTGTGFPQDVRRQLEMAIIAVFRSWNSGRARDYRGIHHIPEHLGTGVTVQEMVFGNRDNRSCSGVYFTRNPENGERLWGDVVVGGQGEEVVSGQVASRPIAAVQDFAAEAYKDLLHWGETLERQGKVAQDIEFVIESGTLFLLQSRAARLTTRGKLFTLIDMVGEGIVSREEALRELNIEALEDLDYASFSQKDVDAADRMGLVMAHGLGVFHGVAVGFAAFSLETIRRLQEEQPHIPCILIKEDTKPEDIEAMYQAAGCATRIGGPTSHAAINARVIGRPCVVNCANLTLIKDSFDTIIEVRADGQVIHEGDYVSLDGNRALLINGPLPVQPQSKDGRTERAAAVFRSWFEEISSAQNERDDGH